MDNNERWSLRRRRDSDIVLRSDGNLEHMDWTTIRRWQAEFKRDYCGECVHEGEPVDERADCPLHWTDIVGQCWNLERPRAA